MWRISTSVSIMVIDLIFFPQKRESFKKYEPVWIIIFLRSWIWRKELTSWPAKWPNITPLDFFLWPMSKISVTVIDHLKEKVRKGVVSVSPDITVVTWRQLRFRLLFLKENNSNNVTIYSHWSLSSITLCLNITW